MIRMFLIGFMLLSAVSHANAAHNPSNNSISLAWEKAPRTFDPRYAIDADSQYLADLLHCSLINFDKNGSTVGSLAIKWQWTDPTTLKMTLNPKAKFGDATAVTSKDVKATYDYFINPAIKKKSPLAGAYAKVASITAPNSNTVIFKLKEPDSTFVTNLMVGILPRKYVSENLINKDSNVKGCGPFNLESVDVGNIQLTRNKNYSLGSIAKADKIIIKIVKDETTRFAKLRKGEVDLVQNIISRDKVKKIAKKYPDLKIKLQPGLKTAYLGFNMKDKILSNKKVRQAISHSINRDAIIKYLLNGLATPATTMLTPNDPYINKKIKPVAYNTKLANQLLDEAGFKAKSGKKRFTLTYKTTQNATRIAIAKAIANDLKKVGIQVKVQPLEWGRFKADVEKGHVQLWSLAWVGFKDPDIYRYAFATESFAPNGGNRGKYSNSQLDNLLSKGRRETDFTKRKKIYDEVQTILQTELPYIFLWHEDNFAIMNKKINDFEIFADGRYSSLKNAYKK